MRKPAHKQAAFTLVEVLVAIAIFAILTALGWKVFDYLIKVKERNVVKEQKLGELQSAYQQVQRDTLQIIPLTANVGGQLEPALSLSNNTDNPRLVMSKAGVSDPLQQGLSPYERIEYRYDAQAKKLYRLKYENLNISNSVQPKSSVLLNHVDQYQVTVLNPDEMTQWPDPTIDFNNKQLLQTLPKGLRIRFSIDNVEYEWIFSLLNTDFLKILNPADSESSTSTPKTDS
ncbi:type II secretion system minor pseudopilin GspJ [Acinetobacter gerneri]|uniref:Type II secretion system protein J n=1 Tax=Acinetobacter gerneri TaxID=202952 RepID=A0AAW8JK73_9GAMM|nr:type II secretion system minor pseudopilin GspJ [Acinetobacter gerneri]MDQ9011193.1 type II secretion system minor pseudopilin GspJ [Acinetobacter gerneri]MDQ9015297.1 type II secretion system minor pseudopilin GspJ [Acinetobacter gerneri]MDQ9026468.1 type II secretion system minor pseudopilin GspJ [Acinetobacter gerneri]MDQ9053749.1 type II secretion system minor pseudopilin GspJ [Acinetobacter gerneri]MDQ9061451.1 type II secretion system minor pseudopilin GspJ [Acinetobacter gerneri]